MDSVYPYRAIHPAPWSSGIGLWSKFPIADARILDDYTLPFMSARIGLPGAEQPISLIVVHVANMLPRTVGDSALWISRSWVRT